MQIGRVRLENYRCFEEFEVVFDKLTILIGENNIGKTTLLSAIDKVLGLGRTFFNEDDFYKTKEMDDPKDSDPIVISIELVPSDGASEFTEEENALFGYSIYVRKDEKISIFIRAEHWYDKDEEEYKTSLQFIKDDEEYGYFSQKYKKMLCFYLLEAVRDVEKDVLSRRGLLPRLLSSVSLTEDTEDDIQGYSQKINELISADLSITEFRNDLKKSISNIIPLADTDDSVALEPVSVNASDLLKASELSLHIYGQNMPHSVRVQGAGSQSILALSLFEAYIKRLGLATPILGVEEPEAHLHPHGQRFVFNFLRAKQSQVLISTHSTFITDKADPYSIRLLRRYDDNILAKSIPVEVDGKAYLSEKEKEKLQRTLNAEGSELFFARVVILVEGPSEKIAYPLFAKAIGKDFDREGISLLMYEGDDFHIFGKIFSKHALDIPYVVQPDGESLTIKKAARRLLSLGLIDNKDIVACGENIGKIVDELLIPNNVYPLWKKVKEVGHNFETYMLSIKGGTKAYFEAISEIHGSDALERYINNRQDLKGKELSDKKKVAEFVKSKNASKPALSQYVTKKYIEEHKDNPVPSLFKRVIERAAELSR